MIVKKFGAVSFGSDKFIKLLEQEALPYGGNLSPINRTLDALSAAPLSCKTVIFEYEVLREFAAHLQQHLWIPSVGAAGRTGAAGRPGCFTYEPPSGVNWRD